MRSKWTGALSSINPLRDSDREGHGGTGRRTQVLRCRASSSSSLTPRDVRDLAEKRRDPRLDEIAHVKASPEHGPRSVGRTGSLRLAWPARAPGASVGVLLIVLVALLASCVDESSGPAFPSAYADALAHDLARPASIVVGSADSAAFAAADSACNGTRSEVDGNPSTAPRADSASLAQMDDSAWRVRAYVSMGIENVTLLGIENVTLREPPRGGSVATGAGRSPGSRRALRTRPPGEAHRDLFGFPTDGWPSRARRGAASGSCCPGC